MIEITFPNGNKRYFSYLEEIADSLTRYFEREVYVSDYENQLDHDSDFIVFGEKFHFKQYDND